jgi:hypothetical protein
MPHLQWRVAPSVCRLPVDASEALDATVSQRVRHQLQRTQVTCTAGGGASVTSLRCVGRGVGVGVGVDKACVGTAANRRQLPNNSRGSCMYSHQLQRTHVT